MLDDHISHIAIRRHVGEKNASSASRPPADAPKPTIGKSVGFVVFTGLSVLDTILVFFAACFPLFFSAIYIAICAYLSDLMI